MDESSSLFHLLAESKRLGYSAVIAALLLFVCAIHAARQSPGKLALPLYKASKTKWIFDAETLVRDSYQKFQDSVYQIKSTEGYQVIVPPKFVGELKVLPEDVLSATEAVADALQSKYTKFSPGQHAGLLTLLVRTRLTQNLTTIIPQLKSELEYVVATEFPECHDWTPVKWQPFAVRAVARLSGRAFVGPSIGRSEAWMDTSTNFAIHVFMACIKLQFFPKWARPVAQYLVWDLRKIRRDIESAKATLGPVIEGRLRDRQVAGGGDEPNDLTQWLIHALPDGEKGDVETHVELQLVVAAASIHTTTNLLCECMFDLAAHPEIQEMLRDEARQVLETEDGWSRKESMTKLKKLDSFMKEVQRLSGHINNICPASFIRKVMKPIRLPDGTRLPPGTRILAAQSGISRDERFYRDASTFDPLRYYRLRQDGPEGAANREQFTSLSDINLNFGAGKHACPGRFFAANEIKLVLAHFLLNFDVRLKDGQARPTPLAMVMTKAPRPDVELEFRRRTMAL